MTSDASRLKWSVLSALAFVAALWWIAYIADVLSLQLTQFGVFPGRLDSLGGILLAPLIHGSYAHLFTNSAPLAVLGAVLLYSYPRSAAVVFGVVYVGSGIGVWFFGREAYHIGASGLNYGLMFFLFFAGLLRGDRRSSAISMLVFFLYGGMVWGIFPNDPSVSFEYHFFGALLGIVLAVVLRKRDPKPVGRRFEWETDEEHEDPLIGDLWKQNPDDAGDDRRH